jgi:hypothetical protein
VKYTIPFVLVFFLCGGCIERYDLPQIEVKPIFTVDGSITSDPGPYYVSLFRSHILNRIVKDPEPVRNATVQIVDDHGNSELLTETLKGGRYISSANGIRGVIGRKYQLKIITPDGHEYETKPELMTDPGKIENLRYEIAPNALNPDDVFKPQHAVKFFIDSKGGAEQSNFIRWRWTTTYEIFEAPAEKTRTYGWPPITVPDPPECSGWIVGLNGLEYFDKCTCCVCWVVNNSYGVLLSNNNFFATKEFNNVLIATVPVEPRTFDLRFHIRVDQLSLTDEAYQYWKLVQAQQAGEGSLFVPNAIRVKGNLFSVNNPEEQVMGIFSVSGISSTSIFIDTKVIPYEILLEERKASCLTVPGTTNERPSFW